MKRPKIWGDVGQTAEARAQSRALDRLDVPYLRDVKPGQVVYKKGEFREITVTPQEISYVWMFVDDNTANRDHAVSFNLEDGYKRVKNGTLLFQVNDPAPRRFGTPTFDGPDVGWRSVAYVGDNWVVTGHTYSYLYSTGGYFTTAVWYNMWYVPAPQEERLQPSSADDQPRQNVFLANTGLFVRFLEARSGLVDDVVASGWRGPATGYGFSSVAWENINPAFVSEFAGERFNINPWLPPNCRPIVLNGYTRRIDAISWSVPAVPSYAQEYFPGSRMHCWGPGRLAFCLPQQAYEPEFEAFEDTFETNEPTQNSFGDWVRQSSMRVLIRTTPVWMVSTNHGNTWFAVDDPTLRNAFARGFPLVKDDVEPSPPPVPTIEEMLAEIDLNESFYDAYADIGAKAQFQSDYIGGNRMAMIVTQVNFGAQPGDSLINRRTELYIGQPGAFTRIPWPADDWVEQERGFPAAFGGVTPPYVVFDERWSRRSRGISLFGGSRGAQKMRMKMCFGYDCLAVPVLSRDSINSNFLLITRDGGANWSLVELPPEVADSATVVPRFPRFEVVRPFKPAQGDDPEDPGMIVYRRNIVGPNGPTSQSHTTEIYVTDGYFLEFRRVAQGRVRGNMSDSIAFIENTLDHVVYHGNLKTPPYVPYVNPAFPGEFDE